MFKRKQPTSSYWPVSKSGSQQNISILFAPWCDLSWLTIARIQVTNIHTYLESLLQMPSSRKLVLTCKTILPEACMLHEMSNLSISSLKKIYLSGSPGAAVPQQFRFHPILHQNHLAEGLWAHIDSGGCRNQSRTWRPASIRSGTCHVAEMRCQFVGMRTWAAHQCQKSITKSD